ncbi:unnamed protein product, partial [Rotaria magnacalcarata]
MKEIKFKYKPGGIRAPLMTVMNTVAILVDTCPPLS